MTLLGTFVSRCFLSVASGVNETFEGVICYVRHVCWTLFRTQCKLRLELLWGNLKGKKHGFGQCLEYKSGADKVLSAAKVPLTDAVHPGPWQSG